MCGGCSCQVTDYRPNQVVGMGLLGVRMGLVRCHNGPVRCQKGLVGIDSMRVSAETLY